MRRKWIWLLVCWLMIAGVAGCGQAATSLPVETTPAALADTPAGEAEPSPRANDESMIAVVVGSGAIGSEFAGFYNALGTKVTLVEFLPRVVPLEDEEVSKQLARSFKKAGIKVMTSSSVESVDTSGALCKVQIKTKKGMIEEEAEVVMSAVGVTPNLENLGLETLGIQTENGKVKVDAWYRTNIPGIYAIGDIVAGPALAHVASAEGITCVEKIAGKEPPSLAVVIILPPTSETSGASCSVS